MPAGFFFVVVTLLLCLLLLLLAQINKENRIVYHLCSMNVSVKKKKKRLLYNLAYLCWYNQAGMDKGILLS